jgi:hypothetical protein
MVLILIVAAGTRDTMPPRFDVAAQVDPHSPPMGRVVKNLVDASLNSS